MHQHPRPPPVTASPAASEQTNPTRTNNPRDQDPQIRRATSPITQGSGSSEEFANARQDQPLENPNTQMQRLNQVVQNFHTKSALIILHSRVDLPPAYHKNQDSKRINRWFNLHIDETDEYKDDIKRWKTCDVVHDRPPPLIIETFLTADVLHQGQRLVILDDDGKRWDVQSILDSLYAKARGNQRWPADCNEILLERWTIELGRPSAPIPPDLANLLPLVYKKSIVLFRSLWTYSNFLPAWKLSRKLGKSRSTMGLKIGYRLIDGSDMGSLSRPDNLSLPLFDSSADVVTKYEFGTTDSPAGPFSVSVLHRTNCDFRIDDSEELLSSRFLGTDDNLFQPSVPGRPSQTEVGSLPIDRRRTLLERPELGHAYGSLSTFHQAGIAPGTSPLSALRNAQDYDASSPPTPEPARPSINTYITSQPSRNSLRAAATARRSSFSVQPFKAPPLSASPYGSSPLASSPRTHARIPTLGSLTEEGGIPPPNARTVSSRRAGSLASDNAVASSASISPKPTSGTRYSSSFSHRRARLSSGGTTLRTDEDQTSSGRGSTTSSAQPGSGLMTEAPDRAGSSASVGDDDDENISGFLKMLELQKDLLAPSSRASAEASTKRTAAALNRFHRMRDSNTALSDSMSSSFLAQRSSASSSRQLSGVPPMVAPTSVSTSSSPGKPISPHTPHTPFAPSRLSAAYSHDDAANTPHSLATQEPAPPSEADTEQTAQARSSAHGPIDIPNSPRIFLPGYQRSSSAQRRPLSAEEDIADLYGMRSASTGAQDRRALQKDPNSRDEVDDATENGTELAEHSTERTSTVARRPLQAHRMSGRIATDGAGSESGSGRSSATPYRQRSTRGGAGRGLTPPQTSISSFGANGGSIERGDSSTSGSWGRGGIRRGSRPDTRFDEDDLPFAMEKSDFHTTPATTSGGNRTNTGRHDDSGISER
ncbi:hypothetical protein B0A52_05863 [Exophiala mesophila]|uniref:Autophagy-related protein 13 n=1 Tax=Exophiala mesophila TaxID=212818 RepID=A0A438N3Q4_EXOME|nr:hypothetical protein B0A52_05863 [Exophiala mesophila]